MTKRKVATKTTTAADDITKLFNLHRLSACQREIIDGSMSKRKGTMRKRKEPTWNDVLMDADGHSEFEGRPVSEVLPRPGCFSEALLTLREELGEYPAVDVLDAACQCALEIVADMCCDGSMKKAAEVLAEDFRQTAEGWPAT